MKKNVLTVAVCLVLICLTAGCAAERADVPERLMNSYYAGFAADAEGFEPIFANYAAGEDGQEKYAMTAGYLKMPTNGDEGYGMHIASNNLGGDMFMGFVKLLGGFEPNTEYSFDINFVIATNAANGDDVIVKTGLVKAYPEIGQAEDGTQRILNIDTGAWSKNGKDVVILGNLEKPEGAAEGFALKPLRIRRTVETNADGAVFLIIGAHSGVEGFTEYYLDDVILHFAKK